MKVNKLSPILAAVCSALLFGASAPFAKLLLGDIEPVSLAAFLYLGCGLSLLLFRLVQKVTAKTPLATEAKLVSSDLGWLIGAILAGGVAAPIIQLFALRNTTGSVASILLNFEGVATTLIAALAFKEHVSRRAWLSILFITLASVLLTVNLHSAWGFSLGALGILAACILWGIDNNFTRNISAKNPLTIVMLKGLAAGSFSLLFSLVLGNHLPQWPVILKAMLLGSLSYGLSIVLFIRALRGLGAARTSALYGTAPLAGLAFSFLLLHESPTLALVLALPLMILGTVLLVTEKHSHLHAHPAVIHDHAHRHDDGHHTHTHEPGVVILPGQMHSHIHEHSELVHDHEHLPDIDHRHAHDLE